MGDVPNEWRDSLKRLISSQEDLEILAEVADQLDVLVFAKELHADVVILSQLPDGREPGLCSHLLAHCPNILLLLLPLEPGPGLLLHMRPSKQELYDLSFETLLTILRRLED